MKRTAIFVDAGYLYAQGSACLQGSKAKRENIKLDHAKLIQLLKDWVCSLQPNASLLRIYWYDGTSRGPTPDHRTLADFDDVKLRLGFINSVGQQKGVDSLLVTDLVELARNGAICDAVLLGGDEDLRIGVQIAQSFGVRLHLIGIEPSRGSQSLQLRQEADTKHEISTSQVANFLELVTPIATVPIVTTSQVAVGASGSSFSIPASVAAPSELEQKLDEGIDRILQRLERNAITEIAQTIVGTFAVPALYDRRVLASCRTALGRDLLMDEKKKMRARFIARVKVLAATPK